MKERYVEIPLFTKRWSEIGLADENVLRLQIDLLKSPYSEPGIDKLRFPIKKSFKKNCVRICKAQFWEYEVISLMTALEKPMTDVLTKEEIFALRKFTAIITDA